MLIPCFAELGECTFHLQARYIKTKYQLPVSKKDSPAENSSPRLPSWVSSGDAQRCREAIENGPFNVHMALINPPTIKYGNFFYRFFSFSMRVQLGNSFVNT